MLIREEYFQKCQNHEILEDESFEEYVSKELINSLTLRKTMKRDCLLQFETHSKHYLR